MIGDNSATNMPYPRIMFRFFPHLLSFSRGSLKKISSPLRGGPDFSSPFRGGSRWGLTNLRPPPNLPLRGGGKVDVPLWRGRKGRSGGSDESRPYRHGPQTPTRPSICMTFYAFMNTFLFMGRHLSCWTYRIFDLDMGIGYYMICDMPVSGRSAVW